MNEFSVGRAAPRREGASLTRGSGVGGPVAQGQPRRGPRRRPGRPSPLSCGATPAPGLGDRSEVSSGGTRWPPRPGPTLPECYLDGFGAGTHRWGTIRFSEAPPLWVGRVLRCVAWGRVRQAPRLNLDPSEDSLERLLETGFPFLAFVRISLYLLSCWEVQCPVSPCFSGRTGRPSREHRPGAHPQVSPGALAPAPCREWRRRGLGAETWEGSSAAPAGVPLL